MANRPIMIMGCTSDAGKSFLVTAICRRLANQGVRVAPFKAQNMSNNAAVTPDGLEIGRAQYLQALAARIQPQARLNMLRHKLPEEDTLHHRGQPQAGQVNLALLAYPYASNLDEFDPLIAEPGVTVTPVRDFASLGDYHALILPGSKNTAASLRHLRATGLAAELSRAARQGTPILGVCGGMQILGQAVLDPHSLEGGDQPGLGLLDLSTTLALEKVTRHVEVGWAEGGRLRGYEIHHGATQPGPRAVPYLDEGLGYQQDNVWGVVVHGLFENTSFRQHFLERLGWLGQAQDWAAGLDAELDRVAGLVASTGLGRIVPVSRV